MTHAYYSNAFSYLESEIVNKRLTVGVLALQGGFAKHCEMLERLDVPFLQVRHKEQLEHCDALILPGGESTTMLLQMQSMNFYEAIKTFSKPIFGTCAGSILMAQNEASLGFVGITVERNAYGRQADSFRTELSIKFCSGQIIPYQATFIRAPIIRQCNPNVTVLASYRDSPVLVQQGRHLCATFHPELTQDPSIHRYFINNLVVNK